MIFSRIEKILKDKEISIKDFCRSLNISEQGYYKMRKNNSVKVETLEKMAHILNVSVGYFFDEETASAGAGIQQHVRGDRNKQSINSDCEQRMKVLEAEIYGFKRELAAKNEIIELLKKQHKK